MKYCPSCDTEKDVSLFSKNARSSDGLQGQCRDCNSARSKAYYLKNKDRVISRAKVWSKENPDARKAADKRYRQSEKGSAYQKVYNKAYRVKNKDRLRSYQKAWREENLDACRAADKRYYQSEHGKATRNAVAARYRAAKLQATPAWLTEEQKADIKSMYALAKKFEALCNVKYHVDHIVPLAGKDICGLHVPWNLQLLPASLNIAKGNKYNGEETLRARK